MSELYQIKILKLFSRLKGNMPIFGLPHVWKIPPNTGTAICSDTIEQFGAKTDLRSCSKIYIFPLFKVAKKMFHEKTKTAVLLKKVPFSQRTHFFNSPRTLRGKMRVEC